MVKQSREIQVRQRHFLKSKDIKKFRQKLLSIIPPETLDTILPKGARVEWLKVGDNEELYAINGQLAFWVVQDDVIPLLMFLKRIPDLPMKSITVDTGAIKFVSNGADIMRPGIVKIDPEIKKDDVVLIKDPNHGTTLAIGKALYDAQEMEKMDKGKVIKNIHSLRDKIWEFSKEFR